MGLVLGLLKVHKGEKLTFLESWFFFVFGFLRTNSGDLHV